MLFSNVGRQTPTKPRTIAPAVASASVDLSFLQPGVLDPQLTFIRNSVASYFDATGSIQIAEAGVPRWEYDPVTLALRGLLSEQARTNLLLNSAAPASQNVDVTAQPYVLTFYGTGSITWSGAASGTLVGAGPFPARAVAGFTPTAGTLTCTVTGQVLYAQIEAAGVTDYSSWVPTTDTTAQRAAEILSMPTDAWFNSVQSSLLGEFISPQVSVSGARCVAGISDGTINNRLAVYALATGINVSTTDVNSNNAGVVTVSTSATVTPNVISKVAGTFNGTTQTVCLNGTTPASGVMTTPVGLNLLTIGSRITSSTKFGGWIRRIQYWPRALSNAELQAVTT
jgi:hypothetical protein